MTTKLPGRARSARRGWLTTPPTPFVWRYLTRMVALVALVLVPWRPAVGQELTTASPLDPRPLTLTVADLPPGFTSDPSRTEYVRAPDGRLSSVAAFNRPADGVGLTLVRSTVHSLASDQAAAAFYATLPVTLSQQGFNPVPAPTIGDASGGYISPDFINGEPVVYHTITYRLESFVVLTTLAGPARSTNEENTAALARTTWSRILAAIRPTAPAPVSAQPATVPSPAVVGAPATTPPGAPGLLFSAVLADAPEIGSNLRLGGFSGLVALDASGTRFMTVTDRGPNDEEQVGKKKSARLTFPQPNFSPSLLTVQVQDGQLQIVERTKLKLPEGYSDPITGAREVSGLSNDSRDEQPWDWSASEKLPYDPYGIDTEGLALDSRDGSFWICEEYGPSILHVAADGTILLRMVPRGLTIDAPAENIREVLPRELAKRKPNRGFEGISISQDGRTLFAILQSPLSNPSKDAGEISRNIRLITLDVSDHKAPLMSGMYVYLAESARKVGGEQDDVKVGDLAALGDTRLLVAERDNQEGGRHKMVYAVDLSKATNLLEKRMPKDQSLEQMDDGDLREAGIKPVAKSAVADLAAYGYSPEKLEGLAVVDERTIAVVNDNDFGFAGFDDRGMAIPSGAETRLVLVRLEIPLR